MDEPNQTNDWLDKFLKNSLPDECPLEAERSMRDKISSFRKTIEKTQNNDRRRSSGVLWRLFNGRGFLWGKKVLPRATVVIASTVLVILGGFLQSKGSHSMLAESITTLKTLVLCNQQLYQAHSMKASIRLSSKNETPVCYTLHWLSPNQIRIQKLNPDKTFASTLWMSEKGIIFYDHTLTREKRLTWIEELKKTDFKPILEYLSPQAIMNFLRDNWQPREQKRDGDCLRVTFSNINTKLKEYKEVTISECTFLPAHIKRKNILTPIQLNGGIYEWITVNLTWNINIQPDLMDPHFKTKVSAKPK